MFPDMKVTSAWSIQRVTRIILRMGAKLELFQNL